MVFVLLTVLFLVIPMGLYYVRQHRLNTPSLQWPVIARLLNLTYEPNPPRISGTRNGRPILIETFPGGARAVCPLDPPSRLRVEIGPKEEMVRRSGMVVPDPVVTGDSEFEEKLLARCSDKGVGLSLFDPILRQRLLAAPSVDILGEGDKVAWVLPSVKDPDLTEQILDTLTVIAEEMSRSPKG